MNRKFRKALKKAYDIPKPIHKDEFLDSLKKRYPKVKKFRYTLLYSKNAIRLMSSLLTVLFVIGVYTVYNDISHIYQIPVIESSQTNSMESPQLSQDETYPATPPSITKDNNNNNNNNNKTTSPFTDISESSEIIPDSHENNYIIPAGTNKTTQTQPKITALVSEQENIITKTTVSIKPSNSGVVSQIHTKPSIASEDEVIVTTNNHSAANDTPSNDSDITLNVVTTFVGHQSTNSHEPLSSSITTDSDFKGIKFTTVSSTTIQTEPTTIPISDKTEDETENSVSKIYPDIYFNKEKMLYDDS